MAKKENQYNWEIKKDPADPKGRYKLYVDGYVVGKTYWKLIGGTPETRYHGITTDPAILCYVYRIGNKILMNTDDGETILHTFKERVKK